MPDSTVPISPGSGANIDVSEVTRDDLTLVERQRMVIASDGNSQLDGIARISEGRLSTSDQATHDFQHALLIELRNITYILSAWTGVQPPGEGQE